MHSVAVAVPVYGQLDLLRRGLAELDAHTPADVELIVVDDCGPERLDDAVVAGCIESRRPWRLVSHASNQGFVSSVNDLFTLAGTRDVVLVNSDVTVLPGWFEGLAAAVCQEGGSTAGSPVATASAMADHGGILSVAELSAALDGSTLDALRALLPPAAEIPVAVAHCTWFRRSAIDRVGGFDQAFSPGYGEEVDWSLRAVRAGFHHRAALGSYVRHAGAASFGASRGLLSLQRRHEALLLWRYRRSWFEIRRFARRADTPLAAAIGTMSRYLRTAGSGAQRAPD